MTDIDKSTALAQDDTDFPSAEDPSTLRVSDSGFDLLKSFEYLSLDAYPNSRSAQTIGYGHTGNVQPGDRITSLQAEQLLNQDAAEAAQTVRDNVDVPITQGQFDALTSYTYSNGAEEFKNSAVLEKLNAGDHAGALAELQRPDTEAGQGIDESMRDRQQEAEAALFGESLPADPAQIHTVVSCDTLWDIADDYKVSRDALIAANPQFAANPDLIFPGQQVTIPSGQEVQEVASAATPPTESPVVAQQYLDPGDYATADKDYAATFLPDETNHFQGEFQKRWDEQPTPEDVALIQERIDISKAGNAPLGF